MRASVFGHGQLRLYLLGLLADRPMHGYELIQELSDRFGGHLRAERRHHLPPARPPPGGGPDRVAQRRAPHDPRDHGRGPRGRRGPERGPRPAAGGGGRVRAAARDRRARLRQGRDAVPPSRPRRRHLLGPHARRAREGTPLRPPRSTTRGRRTSCSPRSGSISAPGCARRRRPVASRRPRSRCSVPTSTRRGRRSSRSSTAEPIRRRGERRRPTGAPRRSDRAPTP